MSNFLAGAEGFLENIVAGFKSAAPVIAAAEPVIQEGAAILGAAVPSTAPYIAAAEGVVSSVEKVAPAAVSGAASLYDDILNLLATGGAEIQALKAMLNKAGTTTVVGQAVVATPAVTSATMTLPPPGNAKS